MSPKDRPLRRVRDAPLTYATYHQGMSTDMVPQEPLRPAAWYPDPSDHNRQRWWNGHEWTDWTLPAPAPVTETWVPVQTNHTFHLLMTVFTCGAWGLVWLAVWAHNQGKTKREITRTR